MAERSLCIAWGWYFHICSQRFFLAPSLRDVAYSPTLLFSFNGSLGLRTTKIYYYSMNRYLYCKYCGKPIDADSVFCSYCGMPLHEKDNYSKTTEGDVLGSKTQIKEGPNSVSNNTRRKTKYVIPILVLLCFVIVALCLWKVFSKKDIADISINKVTQELAAAVKRYDQLYGFHEGLARVCKDKKYGFIDKLGNEIIPCKYDDAENYDKGISIVTIGRKKGAINRYGHMVIPCKYDDINICEEDSLAAAFIDGTSGFIDLEGNVVVPFDYDYCFSFHEGMAAVRKNGLIGFVDKSGQLIIPCKYEEHDAWGFSEGLVGVRIDGGKDGVFDDKWGYIDKTGKVVIPFQPGITGIPFSSGLSVKYRCDETGNIIVYGPRSMPERRFVEGAFINKNGNFASMYFEVQSILGFRNGYCVVMKNNRYGLVNINGEFTIPCEYTLIGNGGDKKYALIEINGKAGFADKATGQIVIPPIYETNLDWSFNEGLIPVKKDGKFGFINEHNQIVIPFIYDDAYAFSEGFAVVERYGKDGYVDRFGHDTFNLY